MSANDGPTSTSPCYLKKINPTCKARKGITVTSIQKATMCATAAFLLCASAAFSQSRRTAPNGLAADDPDPTAALLFASEETSPIIDGDIVVGDSFVNVSGTIATYEWQQAFSYDVYPDDKGQVDGQFAAFPVTLDEIMTGQLEASVEFAYAQSAELSMSMSMEAIHFHFAATTTDLDIKGRFTQQRTGVEVFVNGRRVTQDELALIIAAEEQDASAAGGLAQRLFRLEPVEEKEGAVSPDKNEGDETTPEIAPQTQPSTTKFKVKVSIEVDISIVGKGGKASFEAEVEGTGESFLNDLDRLIARINGLIDRLKG